MVVHAFNSIIQGAKAGQTLCVFGYTELCKKFQDSQDYIIEKTVSKISESQRMSVLFLKEYLVCVCFYFGLFHLVTEFLFVTQVGCICVINPLLHLHCWNDYHVPCCQRNVAFHNYQPMYQGCDWLIQSHVTDVRLHSQPHQPSIILNYLLPGVWFMTSGIIFSLSCI